MRSRTRDRAARIDGWAAAAGLFQALFVILVVNFWIYYARYLYIRRYPAETAATPPTISRAISDPAIGHPFAIWVSISAVLLLGACIIFARVKWRFARSLPDPCGKTRSFLKQGLTAMLVLQFLTSVGMITLSCFPLATARDAHMLGSYIFFLSQALSILVVTAMAFRLKNDPASCAVLRERHGVRVGVYRLRAVLGSLSVFLGLAFGALYVAKDIHGPQQHLVHQIYVISEPSLISSFLLVLATCSVELFASLRQAGSISDRDDPTT